MVKKFIRMALLLSTIIFLSGIFLGVNIDKLQQDHVVEILKTEWDELETVQLLLLMTSVNTTCPESPREVLYPIYKKLEDARQTFEIFSDGRFMLDQERYDAISGDYLHLNIRAWLMSEELRARCGEFHTVAFFFVPSEPNCMAERDVLEGLKDEYGDQFMLFHIDMTQENPALESLKALYDIPGAPAIIVDGQHLFRGFVGKTTISAVFNDDEYESPVT
ncbi:MAG: thioredoxin family protein [Candidatus Altiarchaeota archaeon]|nr:thioredoxin family protein [Candidatus Altiarchaeota archaeon]